MVKSFCVVAPQTGMFGPVNAGQDCSLCYQLDMGAVVGIVACDIILTLLIALSAFCFATVQRKRSRPGGHDAREKTQTASSKRKTVEITESPYQELHGVQSDVYCDLEQFRK